MGEFFAILVAGIDLSVGAILALSGMVTAKLMLAGVDPFLAAMIGGVLVGGALGAINGCLVNWTGLHPFIITLGTNAIFRGITLVISDANSVYGFSFDFVNFFAASCPRYLLTNCRAHPLVSDNAYAARAQHLRTGRQQKFGVLFRD